MKIKYLACLKENKFTQKENRSKMKEKRKNIC